MMKLLRIGEGPSEDGPRLGGRPPRGVCSSNSRLKYFFTVPSDLEFEEVSVFLDPDFGLSNSGKIVQGDGVEVVGHARSQRETEPGHADSALTPHPLMIGAPGPDEQEEEGQVLPHSGSKLGGRAYLVRRGGRLEAQVAELERVGFQQIVQLDFPGAEDAAVGGDWPVGGGLFHLMGRVGERGWEWRCFFEA